jgi:hypothetical protein
VHETCSGRFRRADASALLSVYCDGGNCVFQASGRQRCTMRHMKGTVPMSYVVCRMSYVVCRMSHVVCRMSYGSYEAHTGLIQWGNPLEMTVWRNGSYDATLAGGSHPSGKPSELLYRYPVARSCDTHVRWQKFE